MRLPRSVRVGPHRYQLVVDRHGVLEDTGGCHGSTVTRRLTIAIDGSLEGTAAGEVLLHELLHACLAGHTMDDELEEAVVNAAAGPLLGVLRDNPAIVSALLA